MAHKRHSNGWEPPSKRHRPEQDNANRSNKADYHRSISIPDIPQIAAQYESQVFTHMSGLPAAENGNSDKSYERLEFLGDAYLEVFASRLIWQNFSSLPAGKMSQLRENLVKNETLAEFSCQYGFDVRFQGAAELRQNPIKWVKVKGDMFEAFVAAVVLSNPGTGFDIAEKWLVELWRPRLGLPPEKRIPNMQSKVQLAAKLGGKGVRIDYVDERAPVYEKGDQVFFLGAYLTGWGWENQHLGSGRGTNKTIAGNDAAARALLNTVLLEEILAVRKAALANKGANEMRQESAKEDSSS